MADADPDAADRAYRYMLLVRVASWLLLAFLSLLAFGSLSTMVDASFTPTLRVLGALLTALVVVSFIVLQGQLLRNWHNRGTTVLSAIVVLLSLVLVPLSNAWPMVGISIATAVLVSPRRWAIVVGLAVWVIAGVEVMLDTHRWFDRIGIALAVLLTATLQVTLTRLAVALTEANTSREQLARLRVDSERHRISRDLHDIIGRTLVAASLRNQAAQRLLDRDLERAREQLVQVHEAIAQGQAQLRRLTSGPVIADLSGELSATKALCARLGITCAVDAVPVEEERIGMLAAMIVRESATNMLRHSSPRHCDIAVVRNGRTVTVSVTNDGIAGDPVANGTVGGAAGPRPSGTGQADLRTRVHAIGGSFEAGLLDDERYRVVATLPWHPTDLEDRS